MATPARLREDTSKVADRALSALRRLLAGVPDGRLNEALNDVLPGLVSTYGEAAAMVSVEWYDEARVAAGVTGRYAARVVDLPDPGVSALIGWANQEATSTLALRSLVEGGVFKRVANASRLTVMGNATADPQARGVQRFARSSGGCEFCQMLAGRGSVYTEATADFAAHDSCRCVAVPAFSGAPLPVKPYTPSLRTASDADKARVRAWMRDH